MTTFNPRDSFCDFDRPKLLKLCEFYPDDFSSAERMIFYHEPGLYIASVQEYERFTKLKGMIQITFFW